MGLCSVSGRMRSFISIKVLTPTHLLGTSHQGSYPTPNPTQPNPNTHSKNILMRSRNPFPHLSVLGTHGYLEKFIGLCEYYLRGVEKIFPHWRNELMQALIYRIRLKAEEALYCQHCGTRNELTRVFCKKCRRKLTPQRQGFSH